MDSGSQRITFFELLLVKPRKLLIFAPLNGKIPCGCGVIGSRARLRIWCREACRFESYHPHTHTVFYRQKPTKTAILVGFYCLYQGTTKNRHRFGDLFGDMACFFPSVFSFGWEREEALKTWHHCIAGLRLQDKETNLIIERTAKRPKKPSGLC